MRAASLFVNRLAFSYGGQVEALPLNLPPKPQAYRILCANGGILGRFAGLTLLEPIGNYTAALAYDSCCVYLVTTGGCQTGCECFTPSFDIVVPAVTCNQIAVATVLESVTVPTADQLLLFLSLESLDTEDALKALNQMSGEQYSTLVTAAEIAGHQFVRRLSIHSDRSSQQNLATTHAFAIQHWTSGWKRVEASRSLTAM